MNVGRFQCDECGYTQERTVELGNGRAYICAECIREAAILLRRAELPKDDVPSPEGERKA